MTDTATAAPTESPDAPDDGGNGTSTSWVHRFGVDRFSALYVLAAFFIFFGLTEDNFLVWNGSIEFVLTDKVIVCMLALAFLVPLTTEAFDLSIGANMALSLVIVNKIAQETDLMELFCDSIVKNKRAGIYDGAYKCVALATGQTFERTDEGIKLG